MVVISLWLFLDYMIIWLYVVYGYYMLIVLKQEPFQGNIAQIAVRGTPWYS